MRPSAVCGYEREYAIKVIKVLAGQRRGEGGERRGTEDGDSRPTARWDTFDATHQPVEGIFLVKWPAELDPCCAL